MPNRMILSLLLLLLVAPVRIAQSQQTYISPNLGIEAKSLSKGGIQVLAILPNTPAAQSRLSVGDIIYYDLGSKRPITSPGDIENALLLSSRGEVVIRTRQANSGRLSSITLRSAQAGTPAMLWQELGVYGEALPSGSFLVQSIVSSSKADDLKLVPGDIILTINRQRPASPTAAAMAGQPRFTLDVRRGNTNVEVAFGSKLSTLVVHNNYEQEIAIWKWPNDEAILVGRIPPGEGWSHRYSVERDVAVTVVPARSRSPRINQKMDRDFVEIYFPNGRVDQPTTDDVSMPIANTVQYRVTIRTGTQEAPPLSMFGLRVPNPDQAGTDNDVFVVLYGDKGRSDPIRFSENGLRFEPGQQDEFLFRTADLGRITAMEIWHEGRTAHSNWFLETVGVSRPGEPAARFEFRRWLKEGERARQALDARSAARIPR